MLTATILLSLPLAALLSVLVHVIRSTSAPAVSDAEDQRERQERAFLAYLTRMGR